MTTDRQVLAGDPPMIGLTTDRQVLAGTVSVNGLTTDRQVLAGAAPVISSASMSSPFCCVSASA